MNKKELVNELYTRLDIPKGTCTAIVDEMIVIITDRIKNRDKVVLNGLFTLGSKDIDQHMGRNPRTGDAIVIEAYRKPTCTFNKKLKNIINNRV